MDVRNASDSATIWNEGNDVDDVGDGDDDDVPPSEKRCLRMMFQQKLYHLFNVNAAIVVCVSQLKLKPNVTSCP